MTLAGFHSPEHQGVFTHMGSLRTVSGTGCSPQPFTSAQTTKGAAPFLYVDVVLRRFEVAAGITPALLTV